jgi:hypothetical protein
MISYDGVYALKQGSEKGDSIDSALYGNPALHRFHLIAHAGHDPVFC